MLDVGDKVPDFSLVLADRAGSRTPVAFRSLLSAGPVVLAFYPLAFTSTCTEQVCEMRDAAASLGALETRVVGFSIDTPFTNAAYARLHDLPYGLFSDPNREVVHDLWETQDVVGVRDVAKRGWLLIDRDGRVAARWVTDDADEWSGVKPIEDALAALR